MILITDTNGHLDGKLICSEGMGFGTLEDEEKYYVIKGLDYFDDQLVFLQVKKWNEDMSYE